MTDVSAQAFREAAVQCDRSDVVPSRDFRKWYQMFHQAAENLQELERCQAEITRRIAGALEREDILRLAAAEQCEQVDECREELSKAREVLQRDGWRDVARDADVTLDQLREQIATLKRERDRMREERDEALGRIANALT